MSRSTKEVSRAKDNDIPYVNHPEIDRVCDDLFVAFPWCETKEGYDYWEKIWQKLNKIAEKK